MEPRFFSTYSLEIPNQKSYCCENTAWHESVREAAKEKWWSKHQQSWTDYKPHFLGVFFRYCGMLFSGKKIFTWKSQATWTFFIEYMNYQNYSANLCSKIQSLLGQKTKACRNLLNAQQYLKSNHGDLFLWHADVIGPCI